MIVVGQRLGGAELQEFRPGFHFVRVVAHVERIALQRERLLEIRKFLIREAGGGRGAARAPFPSAPLNFHS